ncbi:hypothetical protein ABI_01850 [Asticcacaulis biprosthecium C19]|uniref:Secreted protein n=1 Tax=Asticcacaulis biprosthecium C19 TaxID=715226 RepID=F4QIB7_9CAUL|nr:hypothetical protein [Asticcacaulis biprosthecium]EGF91755.1 hypothetical protein ABI_01850 [Asticcacaulis biprosthecium C19]
MSRIRLISLVLILTSFSSVAVAQPDRSAAQARQCLTEASRAKVSQAAYRNGGARERAVLRNQVSISELNARRACRRG